MCVPVRLLTCHASDLLSHALILNPCRAGVPEGLPQVRRGQRTDRRRERGLDREGNAACFTGFPARKESTILPRLHRSY